jgi:betaine-aldehyde dehydrogenase
MGPLVSRAQMERVQRYQDIGRREARWPWAGPPADRALQRGLLRGAHDLLRRGQRAAHRTRGGLRAVMAVIPFDDEAEALRIANDSDYGLAAAVWSRDIFKCLRMVKRLQAGVVWVNHMQPTFVEAPWGGYKMSGIGRGAGTLGRGGDTCR